jgi:hypothetical protein
MAVGEAAIGEADTLGAGLELGWSDPPHATDVEATRTRKSRATVVCRRRVESGSMSLDSTQLADVKFRLARRTDDLAFGLTNEHLRWTANLRASVLPSEIGGVGSAGNLGIA